MNANRFRNWTISFIDRASVRSASSLDYARAIARASCCRILTESMPKFHDYFFALLFFSFFLRISLAFAELFSAREMYLQINNS